MDDEELLREIQAAFAVESDERLSALDAQLAELSRGVDEAKRGELLESIYRDAHSLKGAARSVQLIDIETICQAMENVLGQVWRNPGIALTPDFFEVMRHTIENLARISSKEGNAPSSGDVRALVDLLGALLGGLSEGSEGGGQAHHAPAPQPTSPPPAPTATPITTEPPQTKAPPQAAAPVQTEMNVRVSLQKLDDLFRKSESLISAKNAAGEQLEAMRALSRQFDRLARHQDIEQILRDRAWLHDVNRQIKSLVREGERHDHGLGRMVDDLIDNAKRVLMLPCETLFRSLPRMVREIARELGKEADLRMEGGEIEMDRRILDELKDPLIHLIRNSLDHGLETPAERAKAGKPKQGELQLAISRVEGGKICLTLADDGKGIDTEKLRRKAVEIGAISREEAESMDERAAARLIFRSGISSATKVTQLSGRGLGMSIVLERVERIGGQVEVESDPGRGTRILITLPASLATFRGILVTVGKRPFFLPSLQVEAVVRYSWEAVGGTAGQAAIPDGEGILPLIDMASVLKLPSSHIAREGYVSAMILRSGNVRLAFRVDEVHGEQEVLVKSLGPLLKQVRHLSGASILGSGEVVAVLDVNALLRSAQGASDESSRAFLAAPEEKRAKRVLVVEDSFTSRTLLKNILEAAGYEVATAVDGEAGWTSLKGGEFDLVLSDIEMPRLDGIGLTMRIRGERKLSDLPIVLVTSLDSPDDRRRGLDSGADAYVVKSSFDQTNLLDVIARLI
jgi:two-component system chemotaxis sensor kinase CheA